LETAKAEKDPMMCRSKKLDSYDQAFCYEGVAVGTRNPMYCSLIQSESFMQEQRCILHIASEYNDPTVCNQISSPSERDECLRILNETMVA
jgi:hypothetical protein